MCCECTITFGQRCPCIYFSRSIRPAHEVFFSYWRLLWPASCSINGHAAHCQMLRSPDKGAKEALLHESEGRIFMTEHRAALHWLRDIFGRHTKVSLSSASVWYFSDLPWTWLHLSRGRGAAVEQFQSQGLWYLSLHCVPAQAMAPLNLSVV